MKITLSLRTRIKKMRITIIEMDRRTRKEWKKTIMKRTPITSLRLYPRTEDEQ
jgi:hypothetical protein